jgi:hypothetical protein
MADDSEYSLLVAVHDQTGTIARESPPIGCLAEEDVRGGSENDDAAHFSGKVRSTGAVGKRANCARKANGPPKGRRIPPR